MLLKPIGGAATSVNWSTDGLGGFLKVSVGPLEDYQAAIGKKNGGEATGRLVPEGRGDNLETYAGRTNLIATRFGS